MLIRQEENTPIGDFFHDCGISKVFSRLTDTVDEFEVDTDELSNLCDTLVTLSKNLKSQIKKVETEWSKKQQADKIKHEYSSFDI